MSSDFYDDPPRRPLWPLLAALGVAAVVTSCGGVALVGALQQQPSGAGVTTPAADASDPYPRECRIIRDYLRRKYGEGVEVLSWGERSTVQLKGPGGVQSSTVRARWRVPGGGEKSGWFLIPNGDWVERADISD